MSDVWVDVAIFNAAGVCYARLQSDDDHIAASLQPGDVTRPWRDVWGWIGGVPTLAEVDAAT